MKDNLLKYGNDAYYIDLTLLEEKSQLLDSGSKSKELSIARYDTIKTLLEVVLTPPDNEKDDNMLGSAYLLKDTPFDFKLALNTLIIEEIVKTYE